MRYLTALAVSLLIGCNSAEKRDLRDLSNDIIKDPHTTNSLAGEHTLKQNYGSNHTIELKVTEDGLNIIEWTRRLENHPAGWRGNGLPRVGTLEPIIDQKKIAEQSFRPSIRIDYEGLSALELAQETMIDHYITNPECSIKVK